MIPLGFNESFDKMSKDDMLKFAIDLGRFLFTSGLLSRQLYKEDLEGHIKRVCPFVVTLNNQDFVNRVAYGYLTELNFAK